MSDGSLRPIRPIKRVPFVEEVLPIHGHRHAHKIPHDPVRPCAGYGLDNPANAREFIHGFKQLQKEWPHLTPHQRTLRLESLSHQQLKKSGVPAIPVVGRPMTGAFYAETMFNPWQIEMPDRVLNEAKLPEASAKEIATALYHESRHAEQGYLVMRRQAGIVAARSQGKLTPEQQVEEMRRQLKRGGYDFAPRHVLAEAQKQPLHKGDAQEHCAQMMYDNFAGKHEAHKEKAEYLDGRQHQASLALKRYHQILNEEQVAIRKQVRTNLALDDSNTQWMNEQVRLLPPGLSPSERATREAAIMQGHNPAGGQVQAAARQANAEAASEDAKLQRATEYTKREDALYARANTTYHNLPPEADAYDAGNTVTALWDEQ